VRTWIERRFGLRAVGTDLRTEFLAGTTTFLTLSYILFVQPAVLAAAGLDFGAVLLATCLASALGCLLMGSLANYPVAMAPAMGHNFYFAFTVCGATAAGGLGYSWQTALAATFVAGAIFVLLSAVGLREKLLEALPRSLQLAIAGGIGLLIALVGLEWGGIVVARPGTLVGLGDLRSPAARAALAGIAVTSILLARRARGAIVLGVATATVVAAFQGLVRFEGVLGLPRIERPAVLALDLGALLRAREAPVVVLVFFFLALFDTIGTLVGVATRAGLLVDGRLPRARRALLADSIGTTVGAALGTSTLTSYVESAAGVAEGGRTGLTALVVGAWFLVALFLSPLVQVVGGGIEAAGGRLYPTVAPALVTVGALMLQPVARIDWEDWTEAFPAFLTLVIMPFSFSITEGIAFGLVSYAILKLASGRRREIHPLVAACAVLFVLRALFLRGG
jgi:AGZA family xanthine/uracil permease-like MFS transporter